MMIRWAMARSPVTKGYRLAGNGRGTGAVSTACIQGIASTEAGYPCRQGAPCGGPCLW
jgi:hypothetical protein